MYILVSYVEMIQVIRWDLTRERKGSMKSSRGKNSRHKPHVVWGGRREQRLRCVPRSELPTINRKERQRKGEHDKCDGEKEK